jgi:tetratricopeptide (TPR) repeat protein
MIDHILGDDSDEPERIPVLYRIVQAPLVVFHAVVEFVMDYLYSRHWILLPWPDGQQPAVIHKLLGVRASRAKDWPTAMQHLEQAYRLDPRDAVLLNNLAYAIVSAKAPNLALRRAESRASEALQLAPDHPEILAARGAIRTELKKYQDAAAGLERALEVLKGRPRLHQLPADCYDQGGLATLAIVHREKTRQADAETNGS